MTVPFSFFISVQPNAVTIETGLLLGLKARVNAAQGTSPGLDCPQNKLLGSVRDLIPFHGIKSRIEPRKT